MYINIKPYGQILKDRFDLSVKYKLLKEFQGMWLCTRKCLDNYENFGDYLKGRVEKPKKKLGPKYSYASQTNFMEKEIPKTKEDHIHELSLL